MDSHRRSDEKSWEVNIQYIALVKCLHLKKYERICFPAICRRSYNTGMRWANDCVTKYYFFHYRRRGIFRLARLTKRLVESVRYCFLWKAVEQACFASLVRGTGRCGGFTCDFERPCDICLKFGWRI